MQEETTGTEEQVTETGGTTPEPEGNNQAAAEATEGKTQTDPTANDDENVAWLKAKGIDPDDPEFKSKVAKSYREAEKAMHQAKQETGQRLSEGLGVDDDRVSNLEREIKELRFYAEYPEAKGKDDELIAMAKKHPGLAADYDLAGLWKLNQAEQHADAIKEAEERGRAAERERIGRASSATTTPGNASSGRASKTLEEERLERFTSWD